MSSKFEKNAKDSIWKKIQNLINKFFDILKEFAKLALLTWQNINQLGLFLFSLMIKGVVTPTMPAVIAILFFSAVGAIAAAQWFQIGTWLGGIMGIRGMWGIAPGLAGMLLGFSINIFQLAPQLWRLRRDIGKAYVSLGIDPDFQPSGGDNAQSRVSQWLSFDHATLKGLRLASYCLETGLTIAWLVIATKLNFFAQIQAIISLLLPEQTLGIVASTVSLLGKVSEEVSKETDDATF